MAKKDPREVALPGKRRPFPPIAAGRSSLRYFAGVGAGAGAGGVDDVFDQEVEAAFGVAEGAVVVGQAGDSGFLGAAVGLEGSQFGFELGLEVLAGADEGELGFVVFGEGKPSIQIGGI